MHILYLSEDYLYTQVHYNLCATISKQKGVSLSLYCLTREEWENKNNIEILSNKAYKTYLYRLNGSKILYKYNFIYKVKKKYAGLKACMDLKQVDLVHATTLFSEGAVALRIYKEYGIPYIVAVRGTDLNFYFKYMFHLWKLGLDILKHASKVVFITENSYKRFMSIPLIRMMNFSCIATILPNGIDEFWVNHIMNKHSCSMPHKLLYIGKFDKNKNVLRTIKAVLNLKKEFPSLQMTLVGGGNECHEKVLQYCRKYPETFIYKGKIFDKEELARVIRENHIFVMVSHSETFGLVYVEALSQGIPIVYTKGQGIDGCFSERVGEGVLASKTYSISGGIRKVLYNYNEYNVKVNSIRNFSWEEIARKYLDLYIEISN